MDQEFPLAENILLNNLLIILPTLMFVRVIDKYLISFADIVEDSRRFVVLDYWRV